MTTTEQQTPQTAMLQEQDLDRIVTLVEQLLRSSKSNESNKPLSFMLQQDNCAPIVGTVYVVVFIHRALIELRLLSGPVADWDDLQICQKLNSFSKKWQLSFTAIDNANGTLLLMSQ